MRDFPRALRPLLVVPVLLLSACEFLFPPPELPTTHGWRGTLVASVGGRTTRHELAWRNGLARRMTGVEGSRKGLILRPDLGEAWELDEGAKLARIRALRPGESIWDSNGAWPVEPVPFAKFDFAAYQRQYPAHQVTKRQIADTNVGMHACDVLRLDRQLPDGNGMSEVRYLARDLLGLVVRREVRPIVAGSFLDEIEIDEVEAVKVTARPRLFEIPKGWTVERIEPAAPIEKPAPPGTPAKGASAAGPPPIFVAR
jgi:hypothetical protein